MAIQTLNTIKNWFRTGLKPTQAQFWDTWDSFRHKYDKVPVKDVEGIDELLKSKTEQSDFKTINGQSLIGSGDISVGDVGSENLDQVLTNGNRSSQEIFIGEESIQQVHVKDYGVYISTKDKQWAEFSSNGSYLTTQNETEVLTESSFGTEQLYFSVNGGTRQAFFGHLNGLFLKMGQGGSFNLRSDLLTEALTVNVPNTAGYRTMPLSVNGNFADETGNIVIEGVESSQTLDQVLENGNSSGKSANIGGVWINPTPGNNILLGSANTGQGLPNSNYNTIVGIGAGAYASENYYSSMFGTYAGQSSSGMSNTFLGSFSGNLNSGSGAVGIGINAGRSNTNNNVIVLSGLKYGDGGTLLPSNDHQFVIGSVADKPIRFNTNVETPLDFNFPSHSGKLATTADITLQKAFDNSPSGDVTSPNGLNASGISFYTDDSYIYSGMYARKDNGNGNSDSGFIGYDNGVPSILRRQANSSGIAELILSFQKPAITGNSTSVTRVQIPAKPAKNNPNDFYVLATTDDFKTINGNSILGEGNLVISGNSTSGTYTPTLTNGMNIKDITVEDAFWTKIGNVVNVTCSLNLNFTEASKLSSLRISLPFKNTSAATNLGIGNLISPFAAPIPGVVQRDGQNSVLFVLMSSTDSNYHAGTVTITYSTT